MLDTPPTRQALDFLEAPERIVSFLDSGALRLALRPWFDEAGRLQATSRLAFLGRSFESWLDEVEGLDLLRDELVAVRNDLEAWRVDAVEAQWQACRDAITEALDHIEPTRATAEQTDELEVLLEAVNDVLSPPAPWPDPQPPRRPHPLGQSFALLDPVGHHDPATGDDHREVGLREKLRAGSVLITRGADGMFAE